MRTTLESGAWIEHVPVGELKGAHKRAMNRVAKPSVSPGAIDDEGGVDVRELVAGMDIGAWMEDRQDALWAMLITAWSYDLPVPELDKAAGVVTGADAFGELPLDDYEEIGRTLAPHAEKLARTPDPKSSTTSASNGSSRGSAARGSRTG